MNAPVLSYTFTLGEPRRFADLSPTRILHDVVTDDGGPVAAGTGGTVVSRLCRRHGLRGRVRARHRHDRTRAARRSLRGGGVDALRIEQAKLDDYLLNTRHVDGWSKAKFFLGRGFAII